MRQIAQILVNTTQVFILLGTIVVIRLMSEIHSPFVRDRSFLCTITVGISNQSDGNSDGDLFPAKIGI